MKDTSNKIVSVIIVTAGIKDYVMSCLDSLRKQTYPKIEISVIDNSLNPEIRGRIAALFPRTKIYAQKKNISYCEAVNLGIKQASGEYVFCLNDDVFLQEFFLEEALKGFLKEAKIGMVSGKIMRSEGKVLDTTGLV